MNNIFYRKPDIQDSSNILSNIDDDSDFFHGDIVETISSSQNKPSSFGDNVSLANDTCGVVTTGATPLISKGQDTRPGILSSVSSSQQRHSHRIFVFSILSKFTLSYIYNCMRG